MPTVSDDFDRANGALGSNWSAAFGGTNRHAIASNAAVCTASGGSATYHNGYSFGGSGTIFSEAVELGGPSDQGINLALFTTGGSSYAVKRDWAGATALTRDGTTIGTWSPGSFTAGTLRLEKTGSTIRVLYNGVERIAYTDGSPLSVTLVGMSQNSAGDATASYASWTGGDESAGGSSVGAAAHYYRNLLGA